MKTPSREVDGRRRIDLRVHPDALLDPQRLHHELAQHLRRNETELRDVEIERRGVDARRGSASFALQLSFRFADDPTPPAKTEQNESKHELPCLSGDVPVSIVGAGPAGMFCAWRLTQAGIRSQIFDRGKVIRSRRRDLAALSRDGELNPESNYCFGEGGAGTFSDGKLYTRSGKRESINEVLRIFHDCGAPADILIDRRPHIGTNRLPKVITEMRERLEHSGVRFLFDHRASSLNQKDGRLTGLQIDQKQDSEARAVVLATGHSAPDVLHFCADAGVELKAKDFAMGVRIEHPQPLINRIQYGELAQHPALGAASYRLVQNLGDVGVYSFCMCPGGTIVPATTQPRQQVVNGMSPARRRGKYANSGFVTEVKAQHLQPYFEAHGPFAGLEFQSALERRAYEAGGGNYLAPTQRLRDFVEQKISSDLPATSYHRGTATADLNEVLGTLAPAIREGLIRLGELMPGFLDNDAVALGVESRTSSPLRIERDPETLEARGLAGLYPCGEGAGYAGGIVSAALDGFRVADAIIRSGL